MEGEQHPTSQTRLFLCCVQGLPCLDPSNCFVHTLPLLPSSLWAFVTNTCIRFLSLVIGILQLLMDHSSSSESYSTVQSENQSQMPIRLYHRHFSIFHSFHDEAQFIGIPQDLTCLNSSHFPDLSHTPITLVHVTLFPPTNSSVLWTSFSFTSGSSEALHPWLFTSPLLDSCFLLHPLLQLTPAKT